MPLAVAGLARGAFAEAAEHALATGEGAARRGGRPPYAALATAYAGDLERARELHAAGPQSHDGPHRQCVPGAPTSPARSRARPGHLDEAESAVPPRRWSWPRRSGATFLVGVATVGLLAVLGTSGRVEDALRGYADVIGYFARTGNWTHLWTTLRNLAALLRRIGDDAPAAALDVAADHAPGAPAVQARAAAGRSARSRRARRRRRRAPSTTVLHPPLVPRGHFGRKSWPSPGAPLRGHLSQALTTSRRRRADSTNDSAPTHAV